MEFEELSLQFGMLLTALLSYYNLTVEINPD